MNNREKSLAAPIVLVGMMGAGKSSFGRVLAQRLGRRFLDLDTEIEARSGKSIAALFSEEGEAAFRTIEEKTLAELLLIPDIILATGGGAVLSTQSRAHIREKAFSIWLMAEPSALFARIGKDEARPLLQKPDPLAALTEILAARKAYYAEADLHFDTQGPREERVEALCRAVQNARHEE